MVTPALPAQLKGIHATRLYRISYYILLKDFYLKVRTQGIRKVTQGLSKSTAQGLRKVLRKLPRKAVTQTQGLLTKTI